MEKVKLKAENKHYAGFMKGYRFKNGESVEEVPRELAEEMVKSFGVSIVEPEKPKKKKQTTQKKKTTKKQTSEKQGE
ncbi:hypothetical protein [Halobacillus karajensis]|uniref:hypothetical protein n=1 Tax=Halobacillus karajensis TaxID=195088 RepID=UPI00045C4D7E|nr:hypothetical protein [Halobacillus karajensis]CDQ21701.1 hypothetical protein BN982_04110 [Halobacillus karajensis]